MELVPIIYSSLLFVFSLLGVILIFSFIYSKISTSDRPNVRVSRNIEIEKQKHVSKPSINSTHNNKNNVVAREKNDVSRSERETRKIQKVEKTLIEKNKVRVVSSSARSRSRSERIRSDQMMRSDYINSVSRYSVVNNYIREKSEDDDLYAKFSKMSVEYSQSA